MTTCIIAEKPSVARDITRIVGANSKQEGYMEGNGYLVTWAMGHLIALAMPEAYGFSAYKREDLPIRPNPFQLVVRQVRKDKEYISDPAALKQLKVIQSCFDKADRIIVATDAGREGELIFRWIYAHLGCRKPFYRLWISSLTDKAIREGMANLKSGNHYDSLYYSAKARSEADWLVGINASRALSIARRGGYSLGRVQTPTLAMVCRRYIENRDFSSVPYWKLSALMEKEGVSLKAIGITDYESEASAQTALATLRSQSRLKVESVARRVDEHGRIKVTHTSPPLLYDLTALQKEANRRHGFSADKTLSIAQSLYEKKITTYPRTGSRYISEDVFEEVPALLHNIGKPLSNPLNRHSVDNAKITDHHAIIPTGETPSGLLADEAILYNETSAKLFSFFILSILFLFCQFFLFLYLSPMKISPCSQLSFADQIVSARKVKDVFFSQINQLIDWTPLARLIEQVYTKGNSSTGRPSYEGILLFKIELLRTWYGLSDPEVEEQIKDRLSFMRFLGLSLEDSVPDSTTICRFRNALVSGGLNDQLLFEVNRQLEAAGVIIKSGVIVDASVTDSPRRPRDRKSYTMVDDRNEEVGYKEAEAAHFEECTQSNVDGEARWLKKGGQSHYGYKRHTATDENGLILAEVTTPANQSDIKNLNTPLDKLDLPQDTLVLADKGYRSAENEAYLKGRKLRSGLMHRAQKDKPLTSSEKTLNRLISSSRYVVERTFGSIKRWFSGGTARYVGLSKMHMQHTLEAIAYNLYRSPGIIVSNSLQ